MRFIPMDWGLLIPFLALACGGMLQDWPSRIVCRKRICAAFSPWR